MKWQTAVKALLIATASALVLRLCVLEDYRIASNSMSPTLLQGDLVFVNKAAYNLRIPFSTYELLTFRRPLYGEVVAFTLPERGTETFVKRVHGIEGDRIEIRDGKLFRNGQAVTTTESFKGVEPFGPIDVPRGHFFVLGDNSHESVDSRAWGPIPYSCLKGRVSLVWLSLEGGRIRSDRTGIWIRSS